MLPKYHVFLGFVFSLAVYFIFRITLFQASLIFLASVLIDLDHYWFHIKRNKDYNLKRAYHWHKSLPKYHKPIMQVFHTVEFLAIIFLLSYFWIGFLFIFIGMLFHSILDILEMMYKGYNGREFFLLRYLINDKKKYFD